ncbi:metallophosphoesterase [Nisaea acidiphila]|uniref:Metallophosphoesterase n=1 Tax=Nisaea acidiphila TaxID=1862145 RepID=A0A9J7ALA7_9PROT|nr:metallophosphoesterase [Nisaea acidiphila]UUX48264.1 metallophosphoesterase [Nisaea acidiphila]
MTGTQAGKATRARTEKPLFTFAVVSDTHIGPVDGVTPSPWQSNGLANDRARAAIARVNALSPDFVIHLGDMIHPTPDQPGYGAAAKRFREIFTDLEAPLHLVPGNHDIGDKPAIWTPAKCCTEDFIGLYREQFGADFGAFGHGPAHFIMVNSQIINTGTEREKVQWDWLETELESNRDKRLFLFGHQPLWVASSDEEEHYDNTAEPGRSRMRALLKKYGVEAWMSGHIHTFFYERDGNTELYVLPAVSALRLDYSELFKVPPSGPDEFGRNDAPKLGFVFVEIFENGHILHHIRSNGETHVDGGAPPAAPLSPRLHSKLGTLLPIGVELRDPWALPIEIAYSGVVDAFGRKPARDDYRLLALWETGLSRLRIPFEDIRNPESRARARALNACGFRFSTFLFRLPSEAARKQLVEAQDFLEQVNIILPIDEVAGAADGLRTLRDVTGLRVYLSPLRSSADHGHSVDGRFAHVIDHGFAPVELALLDRLGLGEGGDPYVDGVVFETVRETLPCNVIEPILAATDARGLSLSLTVKMGGPNPAALAGNRKDVSAMVVDALDAARNVGKGEIILDTLSDVDRGYFPRFGLFDRRMNPTETSERFLAHHAALIGAKP